MDNNLIHFPQSADPLPSMDARRTITTKPRNLWLLLGFLIAFTIYTVPAILPVAGVITLAVLCWILAILFMEFKKENRDPTLIILHSQTGENHSRSHHL